MIETTDLSLFSVFLSSDLIEQIVIITLTVMSIWSWAVMIEKFFVFINLNRLASNFETMFKNCASLESALEKVEVLSRHPLIDIFIVGMKECTKTSKLSSVEQVMKVAASKAIRKVEKKVPSLGTIGSVSPFIGLLGTVWGIMNSLSITIGQNNNLSMVAQSMSKALLATAIGLCVAIPAYFAYNKFNYDVDKYAERLDCFIIEFIALLSRRLS